jgi:hypothetical protein
MRQSKLHPKENNAWRRNRSCRHATEAQIRSPNQIDFLRDFIGQRPRMRESASKAVYFLKDKSNIVNAGQSQPKTVLPKAGYGKLRQFCAFYSFFGYTRADREKNPEIGHKLALKNQSFLPKLDYPCQVLRIFIDYKIDEMEVV